MSIIDVFHRNLLEWRLHCHYLVGVIQTAKYSAKYFNLSEAQKQERSPSQQLALIVSVCGFSGWFVVANVAY